MQGKQKQIALLVVAAVCLGLVGWMTLGRGDGSNAASASKGGPSKKQVVQPTRSESSAKPREITRSRQNPGSTKQVIEVEENDRSKKERVRRGTKKQQKAAESPAI
jgi:hypothetical protein